MTTKEEIEKARKKLVEKPADEIIELLEELFVFDSIKHFKIITLMRIYKKSMMETLEKLEKIIIERDNT